MGQCPSCQSSLVRITTPSGMIYVCPGCKGRSVSMPVLRKTGAGQEFLADLWRASRNKSAPRVRPCPHCARQMAEVKKAIHNSLVKLDVCSSCSVVWFDTSECQSFVTEGERLASRSSQKPAKRQLPPAAQERIAQRFAETFREERALGADDDQPAEGWQWLPAIMRVPVEMDAPELSRRPWATWSLVAACTLMSVLIWLRAGGPGGAEASR